MTLVVGFNFGAYALVGSDTRVSYLLPSGPQFRDDKIKLVRTDLGLATGAGLINLLDPVKDRLVDTIRFVDDILAVITEVRNEYERTSQWLHDPRVVEALDTTAWMFTYLTLEEGMRVLRLGVTSSERAAPARHVGPGECYLFPPTGTSERQMRGWMEMLRSSTRLLSGGEDEFMDHVAHHAGLVADLMQDVSAVNDGVAPTFQLGIHAAPFAVGISGILGTGDDVAWDWGARDEPERT